METAKKHYRMLVQFLVNTENSLPSMNSEADGIIKCVLDHDGGNGNISNNAKAENRSFHRGRNEKLPDNAEVANRSYPTTSENALDIMLSMQNGL